MLPSSFQLSVVPAAINQCGEAALNSLLAAPSEASSPFAQPPVRGSFYAGPFQVHTDKFCYFIRALDIAMLAAWHVRDLASPRGWLRIFRRIIKPELDNERMQLRLT